MKRYFEGILEIDDKEDLEEVINNLPREQVINILRTILSIAINQGGYNLDEAYIIAQCFLKIEKNEDK